jgi:hypothetical protein
LARESVLQGSPTGCENDARRFGQQVATHYVDNGEDAAVAMASADRNAGGNRAVSFARVALVVVSVAIPLALIASTLVGGTGPLGVNVPEELASPSRSSSVSASPPSAADNRPQQPAARRRRCASDRSKRRSTIRPDKPNHPCETPPSIRSAR